MNALNLNFQDWENYFEKIGEKKFRAKQVSKWLYQKRVFDFTKMSDINKCLQDKLKNDFYIKLPYPIKIQTDSDQTTKFLFRLEDGESIESVLIPDKDRLTLCISTQVGCPVNCAYCVTATLGFIRNLEISEIIGQYIFADNWALKNFNKKITNIVYMGMGEPLLNFHNVLNSLRIFTHEYMLALSKRRITISTVGILNILEKLAKTPYIGSLTISLGGAFQEKREKMIPLGKENSLKKIVEFCKKTRLPKRVRYTFAYVMIKNFNDSIDDAKELAKILKGIPCKINLIPYNENEVRKNLKSPEEKAVKEFQDYLINKNFTVLVRKPRGQNIKAACGMLKADYEKK